MTIGRHLRPSLLQLYLDHNETTITLTNAMTMTKTHTQADKSCCNVIYDQPNVEAGQLVNHLRSALLQLNLDLLGRLAILAHTLVLRSDLAVWTQILNLKD